MAKKKIEVQGTEISINLNKDDEYISLTDIAKKFNKENPSSLIINWLRNKETIEFLGVWETLYNPDFNLIEFDKIKSQAGFNRFVISSSKWIKSTNSIGITSSAGRYGGTFAHKDIALGFCYWLSPPFQLYLIKEFQRLKVQEAHQQQLEWTVQKITDNLDEARNLIKTLPFKQDENKTLLNKRNKTK